jgi:hypothetical protein
MQRPRWVRGTSCYERQIMNGESRLDANAVAPVHAETRLLWARQICSMPVSQGLPPATLHEADELPPGAVLDSSP